MINNLPREIIELLRDCGLSHRRISNATLKTRMYHDLGIYGDIAENIIEDIANKYNIDLTRFEFDNFFPDENPGSNPITIVILQLLPFAGAIIRYYQRNNYEPLTLERVYAAIKNKEWK